MKSENGKKKRRQRLFVYSTGHFDENSTDNNKTYFMNKKVKSN